MEQIKAKEYNEKINKMNNIKTLKDKRIAEQDRIKKRREKTNMFSFLKKKELKTNTINHNSNQGKINEFIKEYPTIVNEIKIIRHIFSVILGIIVIAIFGWIFYIASETYRPLVLFFAPITIVIIMRILFGPMHIIWT